MPPRLPNWASKLVIEQSGDEQQIDWVIERLTSSLNKENCHDLAYFCITKITKAFDDELAAGVTFLRRFDDPRVHRFFELLHDKAESLFKREENFLAKNIAGFEKYGSDDDTGKWLSLV